MSDAKPVLSVQRQEQGGRGSFYIDVGGERAAELTFTTGPDGKVVILDHTEVSPSLRGKGVAKTLVEAAVGWARKADVKLVPLCPFAKAVFDREPSFHDVLST